MIMMPFMSDNRTPSATPKIKKPTIEVKTKPISKRKPRYILGAILLVMLLVSITATYWLTQQNQDIRQQAADSEYESCMLPNGVVAPCTPCTINGTRTINGVEFNCGDEADKDDDGNVISFVQ